MKKLKSITFKSCSKYLIPESVDKLIVWLNEAQKTAKEEGINDLTFQIYAEDDYGCIDINVSLEGTRLETDNEFELRKKIEEEEVLKIKKYKEEQFEKLKKELGK